MSGEVSASPELLDLIERVIAETRALNHGGLERVIFELEAVQTRLRNGEILDAEYRKPLAFSWIAVRTLDGYGDEVEPYLDLVTELGELLD